MKVIITKDYDETCRVVASMIADQINRQPNTKLGLATGGTAEHVYDYIVRDCQAGKVDLSEVRTVNLDEYMGVAADNPVSYVHYMQRNLFSKVNLRPENCYVPSGMNGEAELKTFNSRLYDDGTIDLQLLGIGANGHIGFNEPAEALEAGAHITALTESTIQANARFFARAEDVPKTAITMGVGDILRAKRIVLAATGEAKVEPVRYLLMNDDISTNVPASLLKAHGDVTVVIDRDLADRIGYRG